MKKIVGLSHAGDKKEGTYRLCEQYVNCIAREGAIPVILTPTGAADDVEQIVDMCDGIVLTGGPDVDPCIYGEEKLAECGDISKERDGFELALAKIAFERRKPILAICRGIQVLNVAFGGTLWQDIPSQIPDSVQHSTGKDDYKARHNVTLSCEGILARINFDKKEFEVNSYHHQSIKDIAEPFEIMAISSADGVIEGIYAPNHKFVVGVQWHPERLAHEDVNAKVLFEAFVKAL
jgi:putative glutamine amidotransferase